MSFLARILGKTAAVAAGIMVFFVGFAGGGAACWHFMERNMTESWAEMTNERREGVARVFPVLAECGGDYFFATLEQVTGERADGGCRNVAVAGISGENLGKINADLGKPISHFPRGFPYFYITSEGDGYRDVCMTEPTLQDRVNRSWYRVLRGEIVPMRHVEYGPGQGIAAGFFGFLAGIVLSVIYGKTIGRRVFRGGGQTKAL